MNWPAWPCGHPRSPSNTHRVGKGEVRCAECRNRTSRASYARCKKAANNG